LNPDPKKPPVRLNAKEYHDLRVVIWEYQHYNCLNCGGYMAFDEMSLHHKDTGGMGMKGDDTFENCYGCHIKCHPD
jgi:hypothetical protein